MRRVGPRTRLGAFVVGTGRCGSTLISDLLRDYSHGVSLSEVFTVLGGPAALTGRTTDGQRFWERLSRVHDDVWQVLCAAPDMDELLWCSEERARCAPLKLIPLPHLSDEPDTLLEQLRAFVVRQPSRPVSAHYSAVFDWLRRQQRRNYWIERSGGSLEYVDRLIESWPRAKFVHLFRDGRDCAVSMARHPFFQLRVTRMLAGNALIPAAVAIAHPPALERFGAYWSAVVLHGVRALSRLPHGEVLHLAFEDLVSQPIPVLRQLLGFLGDERAEQLPAQPIERRIHASAPTWLTLPAEDRAALERSCRLGMRALADVPRPCLEERPAGTS